MAKPKIRKIYLTMFIFRHRRYVLCRHKHKTFNSAKNCIERNRTDLKSTAHVFVYEVQERREWVTEAETTIKLNGERLFTRNPYIFIDTLDNYRDGSKKLVDQIVAEMRLNFRQMRRLRLEEHLLNRKQQQEKGAA